MTITKITNEQKSKNIDGIIDFHKQQLQLKYMAWNVCIICMN